MGIVIWPIREWSTGVGSAEDCVVPWFIGMVMPGSMVDPLEDAWLAGRVDGFGFVTVAFLVAAFFFGPAFFATGFAGIGMVMPGMRICADAGPGRVASANALTATVRILFTN